MTDLDEKGKRMRKRGRKSTIAAQQIIYERARRGAQWPACVCALRVLSNVVIVVMHSSVRDGENVGEDCGALTQATRRRRWSGIVSYTVGAFHIPFRMDTCSESNGDGDDSDLVTTIGEEEKR